MFLVITMLISIMTMAQTNQVVWLNGKVMYATPIAKIDSMTFGDDIELDTLYTLLPRTIVRTVHDTILKISTIHDIITTKVYVKDTIYINKCGSDGIGTFFVGPDKKITFSKGNLQYTHSTNSWSFAEHQYDHIGEANITITETNDTLLADRIDLFGESADGGAAKFGVSTSLIREDYLGNFVDWGINQIEDYAPNTWRTLTWDESLYLFQHTRWTMAKVNGVLWLMFIPDDFTIPTDFTMELLSGNFTSTRKDFEETDYAQNVYTLSDFWRMGHFAG